jgi:phosphate transport system substrate-binding protein
MELLAAEYQRLHPGVRVNINGTGSSDGIKAAAEGTSELGISSRDLSPMEKGAGLDEWLIAIDAIAIVTHPSSPIENLSLEQLRDIYSGAINDWSLVDSSKNGRIAVVSREPGSGTRGAFEELINLRDGLVRGAVEFDGTGAIKAEVSRNPHAIGYISLSAVDHLVKAVSIDYVSITPDNVRDGSYPVARDFLLLSREIVHPETQQFIDWILGPEGGVIVNTNWISAE